MHSRVSCKIASELKNNIITPTKRKSGLVFFSTLQICDLRALAPGLHTSCIKHDTGDSFTRAPRGSVKYFTVRTSPVYRCEMAR